MKAMRERIALRKHFVRNHESPIQFREALQCARVPALLFIPTVAISLIAF